MNQARIEAFMLNLNNVQTEENMGYLFFFVGHNHMIPFATIGYADNEGDQVSHLNREGVFRLNLGVSKKTYDQLFPTPQPENTIDYTTLDVFMPHPHYASMFYICILNPSHQNEAKVKELILQAHAIAMEREARRVAK